MKRTIAHIYVIVLAAVISMNFTSNAQDYAPNSYLSNPISLNPATAGLFNADIRTNVSFWRTSYAVGKPQNSISASSDFSLLRNFLPKGDGIGLGLLYIQQNGIDRYSTANLHGGLYFRTVQGVGFAISYHKSIGKKNLHKLSGGFRWMNATSNYAFQNGTTAWYNMSFINFGVLYSANLSKKIGFCIGTNYIDDKYTDNFSYVGLLQTHVGGSLKVRDRFTIFGNLQSVIDRAPYIRFQGMGYVRISLNDILFSPNSTKAVFIGSGYSRNDALLPYLAFEYNNFRVGFSLLKDNSTSYDPKRAKSGFECTLVYNARTPLSKEYRKRNIWHIPSMY